MTTQPGFRVYHWGGHRVLAIPAAPRRLRIAAMHHFPAYSPKTRVARHVMRAANWLGLTNSLLKPISSPLGDVGIEAEAWLDHIRNLTGSAAHAMAIIWPRPERSTARVYAHLFDEAGKPAGFVKLALSAEEQRSIANEAAALRKVAELPLQRCAVPRLLGESTINGHYFAVMESMPNRIRAIEPDWQHVGSVCKSEFGGGQHVVSADTMEQLPWWRKFVATMPPDSVFLKDIRTLAAGGLPVERTHGDFRGHNVRRQGNRFWVFDWEEFSEQGPQLTDEMGFFLCLHRYSLWSEQAPGVQIVAQRYLQNATPEQVRDAMAALAFLHGVRITEATAVLRQWPQLRARVMPAG